VLIPVIVIVGVATYLAYGLPSSPSPDPACFASAVLEVRLGNQRFSIPRAYQPSVSGDPEPKAGARVCQRAGEPPVAAEQFVINTNLWPKTHPDLNPGFRAQVFVQTNLRQHQDWSEEYLWAKRQLREKGIGIEGSEVRHGFLSPPPVGKGMRYFIAATGTFETPEGRPLTFWCNSTPEWTFANPDRTYLGHQCGTRYRWSKNIDVWYRFYDARHPLERWGELDASIQAFIRGLEKDDSGSE
jgi:hypothetical protein